MNMSYKQARKVREKGILNAISQRLVSGQGIKESFKGSVSETMKARATGVKETFDPMNIAKVLTGDSNIGPALIGKMLGRSDEDLKYFTDFGKEKKVKEESTPTQTIPEVVATEPVPETVTPPTVTPVTTTTPKPPTAASGQNSATSQKVRPKRNDEVNYEDKKYRWMGAQWAQVSERTGGTGKIAPRTISPILFQLWSDGSFVNNTEADKPKPEPIPKVEKVEGEKKYRNKKDELTESLARLYETMLKSNEQKKTFVDEEKDRLEEKNTEEERRHKELVDALLKIASGNQKSVEKVSKDKSFLQNLLEFLASTPGLGLGRIGGKDTGKGGTTGEEKGGKDTGKGGAIGEEKGGKDTGKGGTGDTTGEEKGGKDTGKGGTTGEKKGGKGRKSKKGNKGIVKPSTESKPSTTTKVPDKVPSATATKILQSAAYKRAVSFLNFLQKIPGLSLVAGGVLLIQEVSQAISEHEKGEINADELENRIKKSLSAAVGGVAGAEIGAMIGLQLGGIAAAAASATGVGLVAAPFITFGAGVLGSMAGFSLGADAAGTLYDIFTGKQEVPAPQDIQYDQLGQPIGSISATEISPDIKMSPDIKTVSSTINTNNDLKLDQKLAMGGGGTPVVMNNNKTSYNSAGGKSQTIGPDASPRTEDDTINWVVRNSIRVV